MASGRACILHVALLAVGGAMGADTVTPRLVARLLPQVGLRRQTVLFGVLISSVERTTVGFSGAWHRIAGDNFLPLAAFPFNILLNGREVNRVCGVNCD